MGLVSSCAFDAGLASSAMDILITRRVQVGFSRKTRVEMSSHSDTHMRMRTLIDFSYVPR
jgi:hypothetical protein